MPSNSHSKVEEWVRFVSRRFGIFNLVGSGGFVLQMATLTVLTRVLGWNYALASALGIELAILHNFVGHSRWTWSDRRPSGRRAWVVRWVRYQTAKTLVLVVNLAITAVIVAKAGLMPEIASGCAVGACSFLGYFLSDRVIFTTSDRSTFGV